MHSENPSLYVRFRKGRKLQEKIVQTFPYFYDSKMTQNESIPNAFGKPYYQKFYKDSSTKYFLKKSHPDTCQLDVSFENQYLMDNYETLPEYESRIWHIDIETDMGLDTLKADKAITAITFWDSYDNDYTTLSWKKGHKEENEKYSDDWNVYIYATEERMLKEFIRKVKKYDPDMITGWNILNFDIPYIINRMYRLSIDPSGLSPVNQVEA